MARNIEIKARVHDLDALRRRALELADHGPERIEQRDTFFDCPRGRLKLRELEGRAELIAYDRPDAEGPKTSHYEIVPLDETAVPACLRALESALGLRGVVEKSRDLVMVGRTRIHLDEVRGLGHFLELEVVLEAEESTATGEAEARELMIALGVAEQDLVTGAYIDLIEAGDDA